MKVGLKQLHSTQFLLCVSFEKENLQRRRMGQWLSEVTSALVKTHRTTQTKKGKYYYMLPKNKF